MKKIDDNPFSFESYLLRDAQRITAEICERREHKISNSAVMSVQRSHQLFKEFESEAPNIPKIPRNSTPEEEKLFHALLHSLINYREKMRGPLKFQNSQLKGFDIELEETEFRDNETEVTGKTNTDASQTYSEASETHIDADEKARQEIANSDKAIKNSLSAEEEAAIEDDIYKQFGRESFPGNNRGDKNKSKKSAHEIKSLDSKVQDRSSDEKPVNIKNSAANGVFQSKETEKLQTNVIMMLEELPPIMGIDKNVYGPLSPQDIVTIPEPTARILVKNQKGKSIQKYK